MWLSLYFYGQLKVQAAAIFFPTEDSALGLNVFLDNRLFTIAAFSGARMRVKLN